MTKFGNRDGDGFVERRIDDQWGVWSYIACQDSCIVLFKGHGDELFVIQGGTIDRSGYDPELKGGHVVYHGKNGDIEIVGGRWQRVAEHRDFGSFDGGWAQWEGNRVYWDANQDGSFNIFPDGMPTRRSGMEEHDHIVIEGARLSGVDIVGGRVTFKRVNGVTTIDERGYR